MRRRFDGVSVIWYEHSRVLELQRLSSLRVQRAEIMFHLTQLLFDNIDRLALSVGMVAHQLRLQLVHPNKECFCFA